MKKILLATFVFANLSLLAMACEFHGGGGFFSQYDWPTGSYDSTAYDSTDASHISSLNENNEVSSSNDNSSEVKQPDFRYTRTNSSGDSSSIEKDSKLD